MSESVEGSNGSLQKKKYNVENLCDSITSLGLYDFGYEPSLIQLLYSLHGFRKLLSNRLMTLDCATQHTENEKYMKSLDHIMSCMDVADSDEIILKAVRDLSECNMNSSPKKCDYPMRIYEKLETFLNQLEFCESLFALRVSNEENCRICSSQYSGKTCTPKMVLRLNLKVPGCLEELVKYSISPCTRMCYVCRQATFNIWRITYPSRYLMLYPMRLEDNGTLNRTKITVPPLIEIGRAKHIYSLKSVICHQESGNFFTYVSNGENSWDVFGPLQFKKRSCISTNDAQREDNIMCNSFIIVYEKM